MPGRKPSWVSVFSCTMAADRRWVRMTHLDRPVDPLVKMTAMASSGGAVDPDVVGFAVRSASTMFEVHTPNSWPAGRAACAAAT